MYGFVTRTAGSIFSTKIEMRFGKKGTTVKTAKYVLFNIVFLYLKMNYVEVNCCKLTAFSSLTSQLQA